MSPVFHRGKIKTYKPKVSDVSNDKLLETVKELEKSRNVIAPTPGLSHTMPFDIFKTTRGRRSCATRKSVKSPQIYQFNPIRSSSAMTELGKKRWVSASSTVLIFYFATPPNLIFFCTMAVFMFTLFNLYFCVQDASKAKIRWAVGAYNRWRAFRSEIFHQRYTTKVTHYNREIKSIDASAKDVDELQADLCDFIVEIRKENGEQYPPSSMYDLISGLSLYLEREHGFTNKLVSGAFRSVRNTLDNIMKKRTAEGVGGRPERDPILEEHEQVLWEKGILGEDSPDKLRQTVLFFNRC